MRKRGSIEEREKKARLANRSSRRRERRGHRNGKKLALRFLLLLSPSSACCFTEGRDPRVPWRGEGKHTGTERRERREERRDEPAPLSRTKREKTSLPARRKKRRALFAPSTLASLRNPSPGAEEATPARCSGSRREQRGRGRGRKRGGHPDDEAMESFNLSLAALSLARFKTLEKSNSLVRRRGVGGSRSVRHFERREVERNGEWGV